MAEAAVGVLQGQISSTDLNVLNCTLSNDRESFRDKGCLAPKVRKPYTVSKQRERWSEEEHRKFLEALQLHGRAWRRIEEHIGTKTAVQIRSHAQKFFSKVARDASDNGAVDVKQIEIPPPRPKKKPLHPYPRKTVLSSTKEIPVLGKLERPSSPLLSVSEQEHRSPTSVLTAVGSELIDPFFYNNQNGYGSGITSPATSGEEDDGRLSLGLASSSLATRDKRAMELDASSSENHIYSEVPSNEDAPALTLKLFGRTVVVTDSPKQPSAISDNVAAKSTPELISEHNLHEMELDSGKPVEAVIDRDFPVHGILPGARFLPAFNFWPTYNGDAVNLTNLPWLPFYGSIPFPYSYSQQHFASTEDLLQFRAQNECSGTGSNAAYEGCYITESPRSDRCIEEKRSAFTPFFMAPKPGKIENDRVTDKKCARGFVPYRRCALEGKAERPRAAGDSVGDSQGVKLCL